MKILMVCLGNICRSPLAEGILKAKIEEAQLDWQVESAGTGGWHAGEAPDPRSIEIAKKHGLDISKQQARQLELKDLETFDLLFAMDATNYQNIKRLARTNTQKAKVEMIMNIPHPGQNIQVPDPYYGNDGFENVYHMLEVACQAIIEKYKYT